jgi:L-alanine-DL-glutamate epimerase-like enolase superfamily enzyme
VQLRFFRQDLEFAHPWSTARGANARAQVIVLQLERHAGDGITTGLGEASPISRYGESLATVEAFLARVDPKRLSFDDVTASMKYVESIATGHTAAKCALDVALHDGAAKRAGQAVYDFFSLGFREQQHVTSFSIGIAAPDVVHQRALEARDYPVLKLKVGTPNDAAMVAALRQAAPHKPLRLDANEGWTTKERALEMAEHFAADGNIQFIEQPMPAGSAREDLAWLKARSPLPLFADEAYHSAHDAVACSDCYHGVNIKLAKSGGLGAGMQALRAARKLGLQTMVGCMIETSILISAAAHLAELCDYFDLDGNLLITNDPFAGVSAERGVLSFASAQQETGLRVTKR